MQYVANFIWKATQLSPLNTGIVIPRSVARGFSSGGSVLLVVVTVVTPAVGPAVVPAVVVDVITGVVALDLGCGCGLGSSSVLESSITGRLFFTLGVRREAVDFVADPRPNSGVDLGEMYILPVDGCPSGVRAVRPVGVPPVLTASRTTWATCCRISCRNTSRS